MALSSKARLGLVVLVPLIALGVWFVSATNRAGTPSAVPLSGPMPQLAGEGVTGPPIDPAWYRGHAVVVNFWASWCAPCRREQPGLQDLWQEYRSRGVRFVGANHIDRLDDARAYVERFAVTYPSAWDPEGRWAAAFGIPYLPATVIGAPDGGLRWLLAGEQDADTIRRSLEQVLASE